MKLRKRPLPIYYFTRFMFNMMLFFLGGRMKVFGRHRVPKSGPFLVVSNHMSIADAPIFMMGLPPATIHFWIADKWRNMPWFGWLASRVGGIFINREGLDRRAIKEAVAILKAGGTVGLAPEATRSTIGQMIRPKNGAAYLAAQAGCPIVPIGIVGSDNLFGNFLRLRRTKIEVRFGEPFTLPKIDKRIRSKELEAYTDYIMLHIAQVLPKNQHGYYAYTDHPGLPAILNGDDPWPHCYPKTTA